MSDVPAFTSTGGAALIVAAIIVFSLIAFVWCLCRAAALSDQQDFGSWEVEDLDWEPWPTRDDAGTSWRS